MNTKFNIYTDLAVECRETAGDGDGIRHNETVDDGITVTEVEITDDSGAERMGKPIGLYITVESQEMKENDIDAHEHTSKVVTSQMAKLLEAEGITADGVVLIVGLGNWNVTPDALGPRVVEKTLVTRHITDIPNELNGKVRSVCAVTPGVMGITGIETVDMIKGIVGQVKPDLVIAIDAMAARKASRVNATIQMTNTGIRPGGGMAVGEQKSKLRMINKENLGVPVVAVGVPTAHIMQTWYCVV